MAEAASITIDGMPQDLADRLKRRASNHGQSVQSEVLDILEATLAEPRGMSGAEFYAIIRKAVEPLGGIDLDLPPRELMRDLPTFE